MSCFFWKWIPAPKIVKPSFARSSKGKKREGNSVFSNYPIWFDFWFDPTVRRNLLCWRNLIEFFPWYSISFYSPENKKWTQNYSCSIFWVKFRTSSTALLASDTSLQALAMLASKPSCVARPAQQEWELKTSSARMSRAEEILNSHSCWAVLLRCGKRPTLHRSSLYHQFCSIIFCVFCVQVLAPCV